MCVCSYAAMCVLCRREVEYRMQRARVPGAGTEMLGLIFQRPSASSSSKAKEPTVQDKLDKLVALRERYIL